MGLASLTDALSHPKPCLLPTKGRERPDWYQERSQGEHTAQAAPSHSHSVYWPESPARPCAKYKSMSHPWDGFQPSWSSRIKVKNQRKETRKLSGGFREVTKPMSQMPQDYLSVMCGCMGPTVGMSHRRRMKSLISKRICD